MPFTVRTRCLETGVDHNSCLHPCRPPPAQLSVADFLAEGDHVTRMLKDWGDSLDRRLPPPTALRPAAAEGGGHGAHQHGQQAAQHAQHAQQGVQMAPADVRACVTVLRCILLLSKLASRFVGRFLPQASPPEAACTLADACSWPRSVKQRCKAIDCWLICWLAQSHHIRCIFTHPSPPLPTRS